MQNLIDAAQKVDEAVDCLEDLAQNSALAVSVITQMELLAGCRNKTEQRHKDFRFIKGLQLLPYPRPKPLEK